MDNAIVLKYFPNLTETQKEQFAALGTLYPEWNDKINVISRNDIDSLYTRHILHSLAIAKFNLIDQSQNILEGHRRRFPRNTPGDYVSRKTLYPY